ncbi:hypothetical protein P3T40_007938 [Paraburkholderia sp. EB58]|uniref:hypothetical protein n=1 Tax=Paraburkholderia sp. EB58 TaxID=3035125 RepID=UPI003D19031C
MFRVSQQRFGRIASELQSLARFAGETAHSIAEMLVNVSAPRVISRGPVKSCYQRFKGLPRRRDTAGISATCKMNLDNSLNFELCSLKFELTTPTAAYASAISHAETRSCD